VASTDCFLVAIQKLSYGGSNQNAERGHFYG